MKLTAVCPNCKEEILIDGVKLVINGAKDGSGLGAIKHYIGWGDKGKPNVVNPAPPPTQDETNEFSKTLDSALKKSQPTKMDKELGIYLKQEKARDVPSANSAIVAVPPTPTSGTTSINTIVGPGAIPKPEPIIKINKPIKLPDESSTIYVDNTKEEARDILKRESDKRTDLNLSTSTIDAIGREIAKRIAEFKSKGTCLICNTKPGNKENLICDDCLQGIINKKIQAEHKEEEKKKLIW